MLGERLRRFRLARGMSLRDLEAAVDGSVSSQTLSKYKHGKLQPTATTLNQIAAALGVKSAQLLSGSPYHSERRQFLKLPKDERDRILSEQAKEMADFYEDDTEWREWSVGPIIKYDVS